MTVKALLAKRSYGYVVGTCILPVGTLGFLVGFASPYWLFVRAASGYTTVHGLWLVCSQASSSLANCQQTVIRADNWLRGVQFLEVMALFLLLLACVFAVLLNFAQRTLHTRLLEMFAGFGSMFAFFGSLCYLYLTLVSWSSDSLAYSWAFGLSMTGSLLSVVAAVLIATNNPAPRKKTTRGDKRPLWWTRARGKNSLWFYKPRRSVVVARSAVVPPRDDGIRSKTTSLLPLSLHWVSNV